MLNLNEWEILVHALLIRNVVVDQDSEAKQVVDVLFFENRVNIYADKMQRLNV